MKLTDLACKNAKAQERRYKLADGNSLYLEVRENGGRYFRWRYLYAGKEKTLTIGAYPKVSLLEARKAAQVARDKLNAGKRRKLPFIPLARGA